MKGKKLILCAITFAMLMGVAGVFGLGFKIEASNTPMASAKDIAGFSQAYDKTTNEAKDIIFSVEKVYFASNTEDRDEKLKYTDGGEFRSMQGYDNTSLYYGDYALRNEIVAGSYDNKYIVKNNDFVIVDDKNTLTLKNESDKSVYIKEGLLITLGGYYYDDDGNIKNIEKGKGANLELVSVTAWRNTDESGAPITLNGNRTYNSKYYDFVWFLEANSQTEGHYHLKIEYLQTNGSKQTQYFDFYMLLKSNYDDVKDVNGFKYNYAPTIENATALGNRRFEYLKDSSPQYPTLTFDYTRYNMEYTYVTGDETRKVEFDYNQSESSLSLTTSIYNTTTTKPYQIKYSDNHFVTLMFTEIGKYTFEFEYAYNTGNESTVVQNLSVENIELSIKGYQLKYSKLGASSADMEYIEVVQNGTMFILVNGYTDSDKFTKDDDLGVNYTLLQQGGAKTGHVEAKESSAVNDFTAAGFNDWSNISYQTTNQAGLWFTLNDSYLLSTTETTGEPPISNTTIHSYYYRSDTKFENLPDDTKKESFTKITRFNETDYYLVKVAYKYDDSNNINYQYFAFEITAKTPIMNVNLTDKENSSQVDPDTDTDLTSYKYTNKNVYATWENPNRFEAKLYAKVYQGTNGYKYPTEQELLTVSKGGISTNIQSYNYNKREILTDSGSYLISLEVENSSTKIYSYFVIDKEDISGIEVYKANSFYMDNKLNYEIARDANLNAVKYTSSPIIDIDFTLGWDRKASGAEIYGTYKFAPFVKQTSYGTAITNGNDVYQPNYYKLGEFSKPISISEPRDLYAILDINSVLTSQGIYIFELVDEAGNELRYIVVLDRTDAIITATAAGKDVLSGSTITEDVNITWGTHKAIDISGSNETIENMLSGTLPEDYYQEGSTNKFAWSGVFFNNAGAKLLLVENNYSQTTVLRDNNNKNIYELQSNENKIVRNENGNIVGYWTSDSFASNRFVANNNHSLTIKLDSIAKQSYQVKLFGRNMVSGNSNTSYVITLNPDVARGEVYSSSNEGAFDTNVATIGVKPNYFDDSTDKDKIDLITTAKHFGSAQLSGDRLFTFEWTKPEDEEVKVLAVWYNYYRLMSQEELKSITNTNIEEYPYYPYVYESTNYILQFDGDEEVISNYTSITENDVEKCQSNALNVGYETYYQDGELVSKAVTKSGLYIITRELNTQDLKEFSYAFMVDRNQIIEYSIGNSENKLVGEFIHANLQDVDFDNFSIQGLPNKGAQLDNGETLIYKVYAQTNKLPTKIQVPTGKYVSGSNYSIQATSHNSSYLTLSVYFYDDYNLIGGNSDFIKLMTGKQTKSNGYIGLSFADVDNPGYITAFRNARIHSDDNSLSLPGTYIFVIEDTVGKILDTEHNVTDYNSLVIGIKLTNNAPATDVYAYAEMEGSKSSEVHSEGVELDTNQEFVDFIIPAVDENSLQAQLDPKNFSVYQDDTLWLQMIDDELKVNLSGKERKDIILTQPDGSIIVKLDTGLTVENGKIIDYKEYIYKINIQYILKDQSNNDFTQYYKYNSGGETQFHTTTYTVTIDRTPDTDNLSNILSSQSIYFNTYLKELAYDKGLIDSLESNYNINDKFVYRSYTTTQDYYAYSNNLYYVLLNYLSENQGNMQEVNPSMYAITINNGTEIDSEGLAKIYYREVEVVSTIDQDARMGLLPITPIYFGNSSGFYQFTQNGTEYKNLDLTTVNTYQQLIVNNEIGLTNVSGKFYEIVEVDKAGNLTQYVVYFAEDSNSVELTIEGELVLGDTKTVSFMSENDRQRTYRSIDSVTISGLGQEQHANYGKIEIINGIGQLLLTKYVNSTTISTELAGLILDVIEHAGNYTIKYIDVYNVERSVYIDNYSDKELKLSTSALTLQTEQTSDGEINYIDIASVNTTVENLTLYATNIKVYRGNENAEYTGVYDSGIYTLQQVQAIDGLILRGTQIILGGDKAQFSIEITDSLGQKYSVAISTDPDAYQYRINPTTNYYAVNNVIYTAGNVEISYYNSFYTHSISVYVGEGSSSPLADTDARGVYYTSSSFNNYTTLTLKQTEEKFIKYIVVINERSSGNEMQTYTVIIDTRSTIFTINTINLEDMSGFVKDTFNNSVDFNIEDLVDGDYYTQLIPQTVNIAWTTLESEYFDYSYQLIEYLNSDTQPYRYLVNSNDVKGYPLRPKAPTEDDPTTGKYILKVTITGKDGTWIASKIYAIRLTTTISSLYEVKDDVGNVYSYNSITNIAAIMAELELTDGTSIERVASALGFKDTDDMNNKFDSFGRSTAIPMYLSINTLDIHTNLDNGVEATKYIAGDVALYKIESSNYRTFAVIVKVKDMQGNLLSDETIHVTTNANENKTYLISRNVVTIHEPNATEYKLKFNPYNENGSEHFSKNNKIVIDVYYNDEFVKSVVGSGDSANYIEFKTAGTYTLKVRDLAGNYQKFGASDSVVVKIMKGVLFTINDGAPIQYAYYDSPVTLTINANTANSANYESTSIVLTAYLNNSTNEYTGYEKNSNTYVFSEYGTYVIKLKARLSNSEYEVTSQIVFTILNPNEARTALDFTAISNYNILSIMDISAGENNAKDVTSAFMELFNAQPTQNGTFKYSKLITHEKLVEKFGASQGKMKFMVKYLVKDDELLPAREVTFAFTSNNETPTITCSVSAGTKTTKPVTLKFNTLIIYQQMGECNLVVNDVVVLRIDEATAKSEITEVELKTVGKYYITIQGDSGNVATSFHFTIKEPLNTMSIVLIVVVSAIVIGLVVTFIWLRTKMKVR